MNNVVWFETPILKTAAEMEAGDIYRCEYGDYDHWVNAVFESCVGNRNWTDTRFHYVGDSTSRTMCCLCTIDKATYRVIGKET